jgi:hypothetical protein
MKDKQRDLIRMILPSRAAGSARAKSREIHRQERHAVNSVLHQHNPEDEWEDSRYFGRVNTAESYSASEMPYRVRERRDADKLGGLQRWTEHQKKECKGDDSKAYAKCVEVLQPGKNLISKHAMSHVAVWLDAPEARFYRPYMNERDLAVEAAKSRNFMARHYGPVLIDTKELKTLLDRLYATQHGKLNKILKKYSLQKRHCTDDDPCTTKSQRKTKHYFVYDASYWQKWRKVAMWSWDEAVKTGQKAQIRDAVETITSHDIQKCPNRVIINGPADVEPLYNVLCSTNLRANGSYDDNANGVLKDILKLAEQVGLR